MQAGLQAVGVIVAILSLGSSAGATCVDHASGMGGTTGFEIPGQLAWSDVSETDVAIAGDLALAGVTDRNQWFGFLHVVDIQVPQVRVVLGEFEIPDERRVGPIAISGSTVYCGANQVYIVDISDPANPTSPVFRGEITHTQTFTNCTAKGNLAYVMVSDATLPTLVEQITVDGFGKGLVANGNYLHLTDTPCTRKGPGSLVRLRVPKRAGFARLEEPC